MSWFTDLVKQGLGVTSAQKALQWVGENAPRTAEKITNLQPTIQRVSAGLQEPYKQIELPRMEAPSYLPSTVRWFANNLNPVNFGLGFAEGALNAPRNIIGGTTKTGINIGDLMNDKRVPLTKLIGDAAQAGTGILDATIGGAAKNIAEEGFKSIAKSGTIRGMLTKTAKLAMEGAGYGGSYGVLQGAQQPNNEDIGTMFQNILKTGAEGALSGAVAAPVLYGSTKALGKVREINNRIPNKEAGGIEIPSIETLLGRASKTLEPKKYAVETPSVGYEPTGKVKLDENLSKTVDKVHRALSKQGEKTFEKSKSSQALEFFAQKIGAKRLEQIYNETLRYPQKRSITKFWTAIKKAAPNEFNDWQVAVGEEVNTPKRGVGEMLKPEDTSTKIEMTQNPKEVYHASPTGEIKELQASKNGVMGEGIYLHEKQNVAREASAMQGDGNIADIGTYKVKLKTKNLFEANGYPDEITVSKIKKQGFDGIRTPDGEIIIFDPKNVEISSYEKPRPQNPKPWEEAGYYLPEGRTPESRTEIDIPDTFSPAAYPKTKKKTVGGMLKPKQSDYAALPQIKEDYQTRKNNTQADVDRSFKALQEGNGDKLITDNLNRKARSKTMATSKVEFMTKIPKEKAWNVIDAVQDENIYNSSTPEVKAYADEIKAFYKENLAYFNENGVKINEYKQYLPGYWQDKTSSRGIKTLNPTSTRTKEKIYSSYAEGKLDGKTPQYDHPATMSERYMNDNYNAVINKETIREAIDSGLVVPSYVGEAHPDKFSPIDIPGFGSSEFKVNGETYLGKWYGPIDFVKKLNKALGSGDQVTWKKNIGRVAEVAKTMQDFVLSGGIPKTAANFFTFTRVAFKDLPANLLNPRRMVKIAEDFARSMNERKTLEYFSEKAGTIKQIESAGVPFNSIYSAEKLIKPSFMTKLFGKSFGDTWSRWMNEPTFGRFIPLTQISFFEEVRDGLLKKGYKEGEAIQIAGKALMNWEGMASITEQALQGKTRRNALTIAFMAPKYREALLNFMGNNVKSIINIKDPAYQANRRWIMGALAMTAVGEAINYGLNGHFTNENEPGTDTKILIPLSKLLNDPTNKTVLAVPTMWGSSLFAVPRSTVKSVKQLLKGDVAGAARVGILNNASTMIRPVVDVAINKNSWNDPIYNETDVASEKFKKIWDYVMPVSTELKNNKGVISHPFQNFFSLSDKNATDQQKAQSISRAIELPIQVYTTDQLSKKWYFEYLDKYIAGLSGEEKAIFDKLKTNTSPDQYDRRRTMSNAQDRLANPKIVEVESKIARAVSEKTGNPLDPFYLLEPEQQKTFLLMQTLYPGDTQKSALTKANNDWLKPYYANKNEYTKTMQDLGIFEKNEEFEDSKASPEVQEKLDFYGTLPEGTGDRTRYLKQNPDVLAFFKENEARTNAEREKLGLPPKATSNSYGSGSGYNSKLAYIKKGISYQSSNNKAKLKSAAAKIKTGGRKIKVKSIKSVLKNIKGPKKRKSIAFLKKRKAVFPK